MALMAYSSILLIINGYTSDTLVIFKRRFLEHKFLQVNINLEHGRYFWEYADGYLGVDRHMLWHKAFRVLNENFNKMRFNFHSVLNYENNILTKCFINTVILNIGMS